MFDKKLLLAVTALVSLSACVTTSGEEHRADVYKANQVNKAQEVKTVKLIAVLPAKIEVDNSEAKKNTQIIAGLLGAVAGGVVGSNSSNSDNVAVGAVAGGAAGAVAGSLASDTVLVDGVSLTYTYEGKTLNSAQVGKLCEYSPGTAVLLSTNEDETRIQPNATCPKKG